MPNLMLAFLALMWIVSFIKPGEMGMIEPMLLPATIMTIIWRILHSADGTMDS